MNTDEMKAHMLNFGTDETPPKDYRIARGITGWQEGDEPAEVAIRRSRDGAVTELERRIAVLAKALNLQEDDTFSQLDMISGYLAETQCTSVERTMELEAEIEALRAQLTDIVSFTEWAKDTDLSGDDPLTELRHPEQVTAKMVWDMATRKPLSEAAQQWAETRMRELGLLEDADKGSEGE